MAEVVKPHALQASGPAHSGPWLLEVRPRRVRPRARNDKGVALDPLERRENLLGSRGEVDRLRASLAVLEENHAPLKVNVLPFRVKDFAKASPGQDQEADRARRVFVDARAASLLRGVLRSRRSLVDRPRYPGRL